MVSSVIKSKLYIRNNSYQKIKIRPRIISLGFFCNLNTTGYARGSEKLIAMSRKKHTSSDKIKRVWPTAKLNQRR